MSRIPEKCAGRKTTTWSCVSDGMFILVWRNKQKSWPTQTVWPELLCVYLIIKQFSYLSFCFLTNLSLSLWSSVSVIQIPPQASSPCPTCFLFFCPLSLHFLFFAHSSPLPSPQKTRRPYLLSLLNCVCQPNSVSLSLQKHRDARPPSHRATHMHTNRQEDVATSKFGSKKDAIWLRQTLSA